MHVIAPEDCYLACHGDYVEAGESVEVADDTGHQLVAQGWHTPRSNAGRAATAARTERRVAAKVDELEPEAAAEPDQVITLDDKEA